MVALHSNHSTVEYAFRPKIAGDAVASMPAVRRPRMKMANAGVMRIDLGGTILSRMR